MKYIPFLAMKLIAITFVLLTPLSAQSQGAVNSPPSKSSSSKPAIPSKVLLEGWYNMMLEGTKVGYYHEKILHDEANQTVQYFNVTRRVENGVPIEQRVLSVSQFKDLSPVSYQFEEIKPSQRKSVEGIVRAGSMHVQALQKTHVLPPGTFFMGLYAIVLKRQSPLRVNVRYNLSLYNEETHQVQSAKFHLLEKDQASQNLHFRVTIADVAFNAITDVSGRLVRSINGSLALEESNQTDAKDSWSENSLFENQKAK